VTRRGRVGGPRLLACAALLALAGCVGTSRPSRFYTLAPLEVPDGPGVTGADATLAVGPIELPDYLDRQQIVTRAGTNELVVANFDRWGGSLEREITRSLVATLADRLAARKVLVSAWRSATLPAVASSYRAAVSISRFDGVLGRAVVLHARWELVAERGEEAKSLAVRDATVTEKVDGADYGALVAAMQRALVRFGQEMAEGIAAATRIESAP